MTIIKKSTKIMALSSLVLCTPLSALGDESKNHKQETLTGPIKDAGVINKERILYWMVKRGELAKDASEKEKLAAFNRYIAGTENHNHDYQFEIAGKPVINFSAQQKNINKNGLQKAKQRKASKSDPHEVNVLTLLIDFPDLPHDNNQLSANDTSMYYDNYDAEHYQNLMFSETTFPGPNGEALMSAHQYYMSESGGSFKFNGKVFGWLTAEHDASYYGANNEAGTDQAATDLVKEALNKAVVEYDIDLSEFDLIDPADLDGDGIIAEPDGYIDYIMVFHSSVGADAGGGVLGEDAIWAHRWNINNYVIPNTDYNGERNYLAHGYTIQGIDSAIGVVSHEFGHMVANLKDEYDTNSSAPNSPVGFWSVMSGGSWAGDKIAGSMPTGFSPLAKVELQNAFGGNWTNSTSVSIAELQEADKTIDLVDAISHGEDTNLINIELPAAKSVAIKPFAGEGQFHSGSGDNLNNSMSFQVDVPDSEVSHLAMKAFWDIESEWDYAQVFVDGVAIAGNYTIASNESATTFPWYGLVSNYLTAKSASIGHGWVDLTFDVSAYRGENVNVTITYKTDSNTGGEGLFVDDITLKSGENTTVIENGELAVSATLTGFKEISDYVKPSVATQNYYVQLRSYNDVDKGLESKGYDRGVVMWLADSSFYNNQVSIHPGQGFLSVIDADQRIIEDDVYGIWWTTNQIRDAAFSLFDQQEKSADNDLSAISLFDDQLDYSSNLQPESGVLLPIHGLTMEVLEQAEDSSTAKIRLSAQKLPLTASFKTASTLKNTVRFNDGSYGEAEWLSYHWDFGDNSTYSFEKSPTHTYFNSGEYTVKLEITDENGNKSSMEKLISTQGASFTTTVNYLDVSFANTSVWADDSLTYEWDFGDGMKSTEQSPSHTYQESGEYTVTLKATTEDDLTLTATSTLAVKQIAPPISSFITEIKFLKVHGKNQTTLGAGPLIYSWDFGDGSGKKAGTSPTHVYKQDGEYTITLTVKDSLNRVSEYSQTVSVEKAKEQNAGSFSWLLSLFAIFIVMRNGIRTRVS